MIQCALVPDVGIAQNFFAERQYIQLQLSMKPAARKWLLARIFCEFCLAKTHRKRNVVGISKDFGDHIHVVRTAYRSSGLICNQQAKGHTTNENNLTQKGSEFLGGLLKKTQVWIRHSAPCATTQQRVHVPWFFHFESHRIRQEVHKVWNRARQLLAHFYTGARTISRGRSLPDTAKPAVVRRRPGSETSGARPRPR